MDGSMAGLDVAALPQKGQIAYFVSVERARYFDQLAPNNHHSLTRKQLFGNYRSQPSHKMGSAIDNKVLDFLGRLASVVAKQLLTGQRVVVVRCELIEISGPFYRNKVRYLSFLRKRCNIQPSHGPIHYRSPAKIFWRTVRGMVPHKTKRGAEALARLKVFEGVPPPYDKMKRLVSPLALRVLRLAPGRKFTVLGRLSGEVGWKHAAVVAKLEEKRKIRSKAYYERKKALERLRTKAIANREEQLKPINTQLQAYGY